MPILDQLLKEQKEEVGVAIWCDRSSSFIHHRQPSLSSIIHEGNEMDTVQDDPTPRKGN